MKLKLNNLLPSISIVVFGLFGLYISVPLEKDIFSNKADLSKSQDTTRQTISLFFVGDLMGHKPMIEAAKTATGYEYEGWFKHIKNRIEKYFQKF